MALYQQAAEILLARRNAERERFETELGRAGIRTEYEALLRARNALAPRAARGEGVEEYASAERKMTELLLRRGVRPPKPACPVCGDLGFLEGEPCFCLRQLVNDLIGESTLSGFASERFEDARMDLFGDERTAFFKKIYAEGQTLSENPQALPQSVFVYCGKTGTGKTHLVKCVSDGLKKNRKTVLTLPAFAFFDLLSGLYKNEDKRVLLSALSDSDALLVDDLGCEACGEYARNIFVSLLSARIERRRLTMFSTNLLPKDLQAVYGERVLSRLLDKKTSKIYLFDGRDARLSR